MSRTKTNPYPLRSTTKSQSTSSQPSVPSNSATNDPRLTMTQPSSDRLVTLREQDEFIPLESMEVKVVEETTAMVEIDVERNGDTGITPDSQYLDNNPNPKISLPFPLL